MTMMVCQLRKKFRIFKETVDEAIKRNRGGLKRVDIYDSMCNKVSYRSLISAKKLTCAERSTTQKNVRFEQTRFVCIKSVRVYRQQLAI